MDLAKQAFLTWEQHRCRPASLISDFVSSIPTKHHTLAEIDNENIFYSYSRERSGSVVECLTQDRGAAGWSLNGVTALWSLHKTQLS